MDSEHLMNLGIMLAAHAVNWGGETALVLVSVMHPWRWCGGAEHP